MTHQAKQHVVTALQVFIIFGIGLLLIGLVLLAGRIKTSQAENHQDTLDATNTLICMIQVPQPERTPDLATQCRKEVQQADDAATNSTSSSSSATTTTTAATPTAPASTITTTTTPTPNQATTNTVAPKQCTLDLLGICL